MGVITQTMKAAGFREMNKYNESHDAQGKFSSGGSGGGAVHPGTKMTDQEFTAFAGRVGQQRNENRGKEDALRAAGKTDEANAIYAANKDKVKQMLVDQKVQPKDFDDHMKQIARRSGAKPPNVKMSNMFGPTL